MIGLEVEKIPAELKATPQWIVWRLVERDGKTTKVPIDPTTGRPGDATDPRTWRPFDRAVEIARSLGRCGIGFAFSAEDPFTGIDLDKCVGPDGKLEPWAEDVLACFLSYAEFSPSGHGVHVIVKGRMPAESAHKCNGQGSNGQGAIEAYDSRRFFTVTGAKLEYAPAGIHSRQEELTAFCLARLPGTRSAAGEIASAAPNGLADSDVVSFCRTVWPQGRFDRIYFDGELTDYDGDLSRADMALCSFLAFWSGGDPATMDRLYRQSALMRDKWDARRGNTTYGGYTIEKVIRTGTAFFDPGKETESTEPGQPKAESSWEAPILDEEEPAAAFPLHALPPDLADFLQAAAQCLTCPVDFLGTAALAVAGAAIGRSVAVRVKETWVETAALYAAIVARPGATKSPALSLISKPLWAITEDLLHRYKAEMAVAEKGDPKPILRRVAVSDTTAEALAVVLTENPRGVAMVRDELTAWVGGMNQYKDGGKGSDRQFFLSAWAGAALVVDRKGSHAQGPLCIKHPFLTVLGALTPDMISSLAEEKFRDDGFIDRLLLCMPDRVPVRWNDDVIPRALSEAWLFAVRALYERPMPMGNDGREQPFFTTFSPEAKEVYSSWLNAHCAEAEQDDFPDHLEGHWSKMRGYCARLALIVDRLHRGYYPLDGISEEISAASVRAAVHLSEYFKAHARRARGLAGIDDKGARAIIRWLQKTQRRVFSERDARQNFRARFGGDLEALTRTLGWLVRRQCIRPIQTPGKATGRPPTQAFEVNPGILIPKDT